MEPAAKRQKLDTTAQSPALDEDDGESTDFKLAVLSSLHPEKEQNILLDYLLAYDGSVEAAGDALCGKIGKNEDWSPRKRNAVNGYQSSLSTYAGLKEGDKSSAASAGKSLTKKGRTLHLYAPADIEKHTPCSIIHNFLSKEDADACIHELIDEMPTFYRGRFMMFDREVESPHTFRFYVDDYDQVEEQKTEYSYNGGPVKDVGKTPPQMMKISPMVQEKVNEEIQRRIRDFQGGRRLKFQSIDEWKPNASFVNCYDGAKENVGFHSDEGTYLGCRAVIGSLSLGVAREFRVRKIVPQIDASSADEQGQIAIHLPHNSLLIMHAEMQEEWKHSIAPAQTITPHPLAGNKRFNVTYRCYKDYLHPRYTPRCKCNVPCILRCVQKRAATRGRYVWQCSSGQKPGQKSCSWFEWAQFDEDGKPPWWEGYKGNVNLPDEELAAKRRIREKEADE